MGFLDTAGKPPIPLNFAGAGDFENRLAMVPLVDTIACINPKGELIWRAKC